MSFDHVACRRDESDPNVIRVYADPRGANDPAGELVGEARFSPSKGVFVFIANPELVGSHFTPPEIWALHPDSRDRLLREAFAGHDGRRLSWQTFRAVVECFGPTLISAKQDAWLEILSLGDASRDSGSCL